ncbi:beta-microseminoprotein-like [Lampris incognitus]|uniref:beta-microseminoprotein-like n=1 Tax=Lampris incognitus TaxID=2546036 RepID=UPI0024B4CB0B|nr:beta-microseminoprotein-like [Lampris incognitus]
MQLANACSTRKYLALALFFCVLPSYANGGCYVKPMKPGITHCQDDTDKTWHAVGSEWRNSACMDCSCGGCCQAYSTPVQIPDDCVSVFDSEACEYKVHKRDDPSVPCPILAAVGK